MSTPKNKGSYQDRMVSNTENSMKLKDSDRYVNKDVGSNLVKERTLSDQVKDNNYFSDTRRSSSNNGSMSDTSFYIDKSAIMGNNANSSSYHADAYSEKYSNNYTYNHTDDSVNHNTYNSSQVSHGSSNDKIIDNSIIYGSAAVSYSGTSKTETVGNGNRSDAVKSNRYEQTKISSLENEMKLSDVDHYVNNVGGEKIQEKILADQLKDNMIYSQKSQVNNFQTNIIDTAEKINSGNIYGAMSARYSVSTPKNSTIDTARKNSSYEQNKILSAENTLKITETDRYANNIKSDKQKAVQLSGAVINNVVDEDEFLGKRNEKKKSSVAEMAEIALSTGFLRPTVVKAPSIKKVSISSPTANLDKLSKENLIRRALKSQKELDHSEIKYNKYKIKQLKKEKKSIGKEDKSKNVLGKGADAIRHSADVVKNVTNDLQGDASGDNVMMERSYALSGAAAAGTIGATKGIVKKAVSIATLESKYKLKSNKEKKNLVNAQIKELKGVNKTIKNRSVDIHSTYSSSSQIKKTVKYTTEHQKAVDQKLKLTKKEVNAKSKKDKKAKAKKDMKANRMAYVKDLTRKKFINSLIHPQSDQENNMSTGFGGFVASIAQRFMSDYFKALIKWFLGLIGQIILFVATSLASMIITLMPIILPIGAAVGVICGLFSFMFSDTTTAQADAFYCTTVLNNKYNDFNKASHDWLQNNTDTIRGYNVVYANDCSEVNNFQDALLLYIIFSTDNVSSDSSDNSYLVVDSDAEKSALDKAFNMLTYAETSDKTRTVHKKTLADVEGSLTDNQKKMLQLERQLVADGSSFDLGDRQVGDYPDDEGLGSDLIASDTGQAAADYGCKFIGNKYVWGGTDINNGIDCSGFTQYICGTFGVLLPRTSREQVKCGQAVGSLADAKPGDLIFYSRDGTDANVYHVTMYIGNGKMVHASNSKPYPQGGIKISNVYGKPYKIRRVFN